MDQPARTVTGDASIAYHTFNVEDDDPAQVDDPPSSSWFPTDYLTVRRGIVYILSPGHTHTAALTMQAWDQEPPPDNHAAWELTAEAEFACPSGRIALRHAMAEKSTITLELGSSATMYRIRAHSRGRTRVQEIEEDPDTDFDSIDVDPLWHAEEYLLQFWPTRLMPADTPAPFRLPRS